MGERMIQQMHKTLSLTAETGRLAEIREQVDALLRDAGVPDKQRKLLVLAVDEALSAIIAYNIEKGYNEEVSLAIDVDRVRFKATISDSKVLFGNGLSAQDIARERKHQLSLFMLCKVLDEISYSYKRGFENQLTLIKFL